MKRRRSCSEESGKLWAPWRSKYIHLEGRKGCIFCIKSLKGASADKKNYILRKTGHSFSMLNIYPYNAGHVMVAPFMHTRDIAELSDRQLLDLMKLLRDTLGLLNRKLHPDAFNVGINIGKTAGAGFSGHLHIHVVPRWKGDTNFMPVVADTKVISDSLESMYERLTI